MQVSKQINDKKPRSVEMYAFPFNGIMLTIAIEDGNNRTAINMTNSQAKVLIDVLSRIIAESKAA